MIPEVGTAWINVGATRDGSASGGKRGWGESTVWVSSHDPSPKGGKSYKAYVEQGGNENKISRRNRTAKARGQKRREYRRNGISFCLLCIELIQFTH